METTMPERIGMRVGAICGAEPKTKIVKFFGYGVYEGDHTPPAEAGGFNFGFANPRIKLDSGKTVWGCECWWGPESQIKAELEVYKTKGYTIQDVDIDAEREAAK